MALVFFDQGQAGGRPYQTPRVYHTATGDGSDGGAERQSRTGYASNLGRTAKQKRARPTADRDQRSLLLPIAGGRRRRRPRPSRLSPPRAAKGLSAARQHFCETGHAGFY